MRIKKFISVILICIFCASYASGALAYFPDIEDATYKQDILDLYKLGIVKGGDDGNFAPYDPVTRAEFCQILIRLNGEASVKSDRIYFADVPQTHPYFDAVGYAATRGLINGYPDGNFYPDEYITYDQANKVLIDFLGYKYWAEARGGYPNGYRIQAGNIELSDGLELSYEISINRSEICRLINNALRIPLVDMVGVGEDGIYDINDDVTIMTRYLKLKEISGFVDANSIYGLNGNTAQEGCIMIDGVNYSINDVTLNSYVGKPVKAIVKIDDNAKREEILLLNEDENSEIMLSHQNSIYYDNYTLSYYTSDNKQESVKIAPDLKLIYNGEEKIFDKSYINSLTNGTVRLISKAQTSVYDVMIISSYTSIYVDSKNEYKETVYDPTKAYGLDFSKDKIYNVVDFDNRNVSFEDIAVGSVLTYYENMSYAEGFVSSYSVSGTLSELGEEMGIPCAIVNGEKIKLSQTTKNILTSFGLGSQIKLYLDVYDYAVYAEKISISTDKIKYLFKIGDSFDGALNSTLMGKFYDIDNGIEIIEFADNIKLNGTPIENPTVSDISISIPQMVQIKMDDDNKITSVTTAKSFEEFMSNPGNDGFCEVFAFKNRKFQVDSDSFDNKILFNDNSTKIMIVPENMSNYSDKDFRTVTSTSFTSGEAYNVAAYNSTVDYVIPDMIVCKMSANESTDITLSKGDRLFTISGISQVTDEDGDEVTKVTGYIGSNERFFYIDPEDNIVDKYDATLNVNDLVVGDIIFCNRNSNNYIKAFTRFYNEDDGYIQKITYTDINRPIVIMHSEAKKVADPYIYFLDENGDNPYDYYMFKSGTNITVVTPSPNGIDVRGGTVADIDIGDEIIVHIRYTIVDGIVVFKK